MFKIIGDRVNMMNNINMYYPSWPFDDEIMICPCKDRCPNDTKCGHYEPHIKSSECNYNCYDECDLSCVPYSDDDFITADEMVI